MAFSTKEKQNEYSRKYYHENRDKVRAQMKRWREKNADKHRAKSREYHHKNRETVLSQKRARWKEMSGEYNARRRARKFGLSANAYSEMYAAQNGCCAICGDRKKLAVDHNHTTGMVRALLCSPCNTALGLFKENPRRLLSALDYLDHHALAEREFLNIALSLVKPCDMSWLSLSEAA